MASGKERIFTLHWKIKNLYYSKLLTGECIPSPSFNLPIFGVSEWNLNFYREKDSAVNAESFSFSLSCHSRILTTKATGSMTGKVHTKTNVSTKNHSVEQEMSMVPGSQHYILKHREIQHSDSLIISFELRYLDSDCRYTQFITEEIVPSDTPETVSEQVSSPFHKLNVYNNLRQSEATKEPFEFPTKCFAQTVFCFEKNTAIVPFDISLVTGNEMKHSIPVTLSTYLPPLIITIGSPNEKEHLPVQICVLQEKRIGPRLVICQLSVLFDSSNAIQLEPEEHLFCLPEEDEVWTLERIIHATNLIPKLEKSSSNSATLKLEFTYSDGNHRSEMLWEETANDVDSVLPVNVPMLSRQMTIFYNENKFCDVVLKVGDKTYNAHRTVLAAMSPVFYAMFESDMVESATRSVDIVNFDEDTVDALLNYMYGGLMVNLGMEKAQKLYSAADYYQLVPLRNLCGKWLIDKVSFSNVFEMLTLADRHHDSVLKDAAINFICFCERVALDSEKWKELKKENLVLTCEVLEKMCREDC